MISDLLPRGSKKKMNPHRQLVASAGMTRDHLLALHQEFFSHAYPSSFWTLKSFQVYANKIKWSFNSIESNSKEDIRRLYCSFLPYGQLYLTFADLSLASPA
jgi:hypothetical protein